MSPLATATLGTHMNPWGRPTRRRLLREALAAGGFLAGACSAPATGGPSQPAAAGALAPGTRLSFASWGGPDVQDISKRFAQTFMEQHPGVSVEFISTASQNHNEKITAASAAGTPIDVFYLQPSDTPSFVERGLVRSLDDLVKRDRYDTSDFFEKCLGQYLWKGKLYALPRGFGNQDVYYNVSMLEAAGVAKPPYDWNAKTWTTDDFLDAAKRLVRLSSGDVAVWGWNQGRGLRQWAPWVWIFGGDILNKDGTQCILDQPPAVDGLQFVQDLIYKHRVMPAPDQKVNTQNAFGSSQLGMALGIPADLTSYRKLQGISWDVAPMPRKATRLTSGGGVAWHLAAATASLAGAWELLKLVASTEFQTSECQAAATAPPRKSVLRSPCFVDRSQPPKGIDVFLQAPDFVHPDPQAVAWPDIEVEINKGLASLWDGSKTARQVAQEIVPQANRLLATSSR